MRRKLMMTAFVIAAVLTITPEALKQLHELRITAEDWTRVGLWNNFLTVYAHEGKSAPAASVNAVVQDTASNEEFRWRGNIARGRAIEIKGINGGVHAEAASGTEVEVVADKKGRRSDPKDVRIQVLEHADGVTICALYPSDDPNSPNVCEAGDRWRSRTRNNDVQVNFTVRVPAGVRFVGRTVNGGVEANSIGSDVEAYTVNGGVRVTATGHAQARTVNGSITASLGNANWTKPLEFKTVNGSITLDLPNDTSTQVEADTVNGDISTDFPLTVQGRLNRRHLSGTIGGGGRELRLKTVNGSIRLRRAHGLSF